MEVGTINSARKRPSRYVSESYITYDFKCMYLLAAFFVLGAVLGSIVGSFSAIGRIVGIEQYLLPDFTKKSFTAVLWGISRYHLLAIFFGTSIFGPVMLPILCAFRGYLISVTAASIITGVSAVNGALLTVVYLGIPLIFSLPSFFVISIDAFSFSKKLYSLATGSHKQASSTPFLRHSLLCALAVMISSLIEAYILPSFLIAIM